MGATYTRQSSGTIVDGSTIEAAHFNNEFDQLLAAFAVSSGHTHDGTAAEGGPITKLLGTAITIGDATSGTDIAMTFDGESNDGVLTWMEDEDYFQFSDDLLLSTTEKLQFRDTAIYINSSTDGQLDLVADTEIQIAATTIDINGNVDVSGTLTVAGAVDFGDAALSNVGALQLDSIAGDADTNTSITFSGSDVITVATGGAGRLTIGDGALSPVTNNQIDLGTSSLEFKDAFFDGTVTADAFAGPLTGNVTGNVSGTAATVTTAAQSNITSLGTLTTLTVDNVITNGATIGHTSDTDLLTLADGVLTIAGDLVVSGDDITMGTNTDGNLLVADGTNFNSVAVSSLSEISTAASGDIFIAIDASGGGLKKITRSAVIAGTGSSGDLANVVEDTSPQLGGNLDTNSANILIDDAHFIADENGNEQIIFQTTGSAVNQFDITNSASSTAFLQGPILQATGDDSNIDLNLIAKGTGVIAVRGNSASGAVQFNCESNSHGQIVQGQPHSAGVTNTMLLPAGANSTLVSLVSADTLTNKTLTAPTLTGTATVASLDISGDIDVDGTTNLDVVDIDGAVNMASTALVTGVLTTTAATVFNGGFASNADSTMGTDKKIIFRDAAIHISSTADGDLSIAADDEIDLTSTLIDINGNVEISGTVAAADAITMATNKKVVFRDAALFINSSADGQLDLAADTEIELTATTVDVVGNFTNSGTIVSTGKITSDAGIDIDNFNIDGTTIALSSGDMTVDVAGDLILDAGGGDFKFGVGDTEILRITNSSSDVIIRPVVDAKDIIFQQRDGTAVMTVEDAISLTINNDVSVVGRATGTITTDNDGNLDLAVSNNFKVTTSGDLTLTLTNPAIGQSGNILFINDSDRTISAHASLLINADVLSAISASGSYHLTYYATATSGNNTILVSASAILT